MALVKPQFEAGKDKVGKKELFVIKSPFRSFGKTAAMATEIGFVVKDASFSPITGGEGNIEFYSI